MVKLRILNRHIFVDLNRFIKDNDEFIDGLEVARRLTNIMGFRWFCGGCNGNVCMYYCSNEDWIEEIIKKNKRNTVIEI